MLAIVTTHPIQYQTPIWRALAADGHVPFEVWYLTDFGVRPSRDRQFDKTFQWDIDLLSGYPHAFLKTAAGATPADFWRCRLAENLRARVANAGVKALWIQGWQVAGYWQAARQAKAAGAKSGCAPRATISRRCRYGSARSSAQRWAICSSASAAFSLSGRPTAGSTGIMACPSPNFWPRPTPSTMRALPRRPMPCADSAPTSAAPGASPTTPSACCSAASSSPKNDRWI